MAPNTSKIQRLFAQEECLILLASMYAITEKRQKKFRKHRWWVHQLFRNKHRYGAYYTLVNELRFDDEKFKQYFRLTRYQFAQVLELVENDLVKHCRSREVICPRQRLAICIRFLATGESFRSIAFDYRVGYTTVGNIVSEVCKVIWNRLSAVFMPFPNTINEWKVIAADFWTKWQFPHCLGAIDGKHIVMKAPPNTGSLYFNYKNTFSTVLMALVDANLQFICIDVGAYGRNSDGGVFANSNLGKGIATNRLNLPDDSTLPEAECLGNAPYVFVGDEAFPLQKHILRPYPGRGCPHDQQIFNMRLSRARRIVENCFGILAARWRVYHTKIAVRAEWVNDIVKATCVLHNFIQRETTPGQTTELSQEAGRTAIEGMRELPRVGNRAGVEAMRCRKLFKEFFCNIAPVDWQEAHVTRGTFMA